jgi:hypothetical protein
MPEGMQFTAEHVSSIAARAAELERIGEERQDPQALVRAARLYTLAVRIVDDIDSREAMPFLHSDLARVRDELRTLATDAVTNGSAGDSHHASTAAESNGTILRMFREIAARIEHRLAEDGGAPVGRRAASRRPSDGRRDDQPGTR